MTEENRMFGATRYTDDELRMMAAEFVTAERASDMRCLQVTLTLSMKTGLHPEECRNRIVAMAGVDLKV